MWNKARSSTIKYERDEKSANMVKDHADEEEAVSNGSWKELSEVQDDCNIQKERLDEANDTHWEVYDSAVDESTSTDDEDCHA